MRVAVVEVSRRCCSWLLVLRVSVISRLWSRSSVIRPQHYKTQQQMGELRGFSSSTLHSFSDDADTKPVIVKFRLVLCMLRVIFQVLFHVKWSTPYIR
jgi:hypothetical protein